MYTAPAARTANAYLRQAAASRVAAASPHELIAMLFEGVDQTLLSALGALERGDIPAKAAALSKAVRLLDEGLRAALDPKGGELTERLDALYDYCILRLTQANLHNDAKGIEEVRGLLAPVADAWNQIRPQ
ncbi:Flagellar protein FliS [Tepidimonas alkaliphilus]|uniref:Flagellar secretion chaperone FliS n=1 Tax=Tepidimonas alkaliphilus TaxID=2588942 RepID=A0A554W4U9_9BURK|nr:flagellar export chaperone FliS [Tepidimonas alkaliphilus]TSE18602.1 Flagellar protein FliS [Tepidimonas alkaliphilus]